MLHWKISVAKQMSGIDYFICPEFTTTCLVKTKVRLPYLTEKKQVKAIYSTTWPSA